MTQAYYRKTPQQALEAQNASAEGLSAQEARRRAEQYGPNKLSEGKKKSTLEVFLEQFKDLMVLILIIAAVISAFSGNVESTIVIFAVLVLNAILGTVQYEKAEKSLESLKAMASPTAKVMRGGVRVEIPSADVVPGDIVLLEAGDMVVADGRVLENFSLKVNESSLTGESEGVDKTAEAIDADQVALGDQKNMVFSGSLVTYGRATVLVTGTGMDTELGKIAALMNQTQQRKTPLQQSLDSFSAKLAMVIMAICAVVFALSIFRTGMGILDSLMFAVALAVAAIPEALSSIVTIVLAMGTQKMARQNAIMKDLKAVESLGSVSVICSDKTGTLTQNKMTVVDHFGNTLKTARAMSLCSDAAPDETGNAVGEPTECALVNWATKEGLGKSAMERETPRVGEAPFDSGRKMMSTIHKLEKGYVQYTKGAPDELLKCCTHYEKDGKILPLDEQAKAEILAQNKAMADQALRVLAAAERRYDEMPQDQSPAALEHDLTFLGLAGMIDPIRPEVKAAIAECKTAGIRAVMITGDHRDTAVAIAKQLGILEHDDQAITGAQLNQISDEELDKTIDHYSVYARVQPEHKVRIVNAWKKRGCITAMTGDGVNDAPSIKSADIGVGMGITGTDVTKNVADMVLADDNFATIVGAVQEGRRIYDNIRKAIQFLLGSNMSEVLSVFIATLLGFVILEPVHLLWINLITDCFPALALGMEKGEPDLMQRPPRKASDGIFSNGLGFDVAYQGAMVTVLVLAAYFIGHFMESGVWEITQSADGMTMAFLTMSMAEIFHSFNMRSQRGSVFKLHSHNKVLWGAMLLSLVLTTGVIYLPGISDAFGFTHINPVEYAVALILAILVIPIVECVKAVQRSMHKR